MIFTSEQMHGADKYAVEVLNIPSTGLMRSAAKALFDACGEFPTANNFVVLTGKGNNGGDGFCLAGLLKNAGKNVTVVAVYGTKNLSPDAETMFSELDKETVYDVWENGIADAVRLVEDADVIVDCIFGTGFAGELKADAKILAEATCGKHVIACDVPSGVHCDTGAVYGTAIRADITVTFAAKKPFMFLYPSKNYIGRVVIADIGLPAEALGKQNPYIYENDGRVLASVKKRKQNTNKGSFGTVQVVCGTKKMTGAAVLCCSGALRSGVGLVYAASDKKTRRIIQTHLAEPVFVKRKKKVKKADAFVVGCGLGKKGKVVKKYLKRKRPCVIDADALNYLAKHKNKLKRLRPDCVLTPHPAEMARLCDCSVAKIEENRFGAARDFAVAYNTTVLLKGNRTLIADPQGNVYVNMSGNSALAKGGSGDVLAGVIGSLLAQGYDAVTAARLGAYIHGSAAEILTENGNSEASVLPSDLPRVIGNLI